MLRLKKILCLLICVVIFATTACSSNGEVFLKNDLYTVRFKDGQYYLNPNQAVKTPSYGNMEILPIAGYPSFDSLSDMKAAIIEGNFDDKVLHALQTSRDSEGNIVICDINNLYTPTLPEGLSMTSVSWYGDSYMFNVAQLPETNSFCTVFYFSERAFNLHVKDFTEFTENELILEIVSTKTDPYTNGTIIENRTSGGLWTDILSTLTSENKVLYVHEAYVDTNGIAEYVEAWGIDNGVHYYVIMTGLEARPTIEFLLSFGMEPYVETEEEPIP